MKFSMLWFGLQTEFYSTQDITLRTPTKKKPTSGSIFIYSYIYSYVVTYIYVT